MAISLNFTKNNDDYWETSCISEGVPFAIEVNRTSAGYIIIYGSIDNMDKVTLRNFGPGAEPNLILEIDVPADVKVTIVSHTEVVMAKIAGV